MPEDALVELKSFGLLHEARQAQDVLTEAGIPCILADEHMGSPGWAYVTANRGVRLLVAASRADEAMAAIQEFEDLQTAEIPDYELAAQAWEADREEQED